ncbi:hypothetical protein [Photobacterium leiognathi]|uniref:hypothetical protein n=1 Tax=Photobacterium leiognathi TaxID=553611 RepID=UPI0002088068|nr:hypothetical protein [Photobacterium leiognathi]PSW48360.1 hypothetical protein CTM83_20220 [Photobacterium leiognathi subsp. mandapamensis]GAA03203.1 hypothetical protein PMSV_4128 [Photobacterium leiognathi subsp. mandapamensis svers.1.1.]
MECRENDSNFAKIVVSHTLAYLDHFNVRRDEFVLNRLIPALEKAGVVIADDIQCGNSYQKWKGRKCKQVERMIKGETPIPASYVLPWIASLPTKFSKRALVDVAGCIGTVYTPIEIMPTAPTSGAIRSRLDEISKEFADVLQHAEPAMDGSYDDTDCEHALQLLSDELYELHAATLNEMSRIFRARGVLPRGHKMMMNSPLFMELGND